MKKPYYDDVTRDLFISYAKQYLGIVYDCKKSDTGKYYDVMVICNEYDYWYHIAVEVKYRQGYSSSYIEDKGGPIIDKVKLDSFLRDKHDDFIREGLLCTICNDSTVLLSNIEDFDLQTLFANKTTRTGLPSDGQKTKKNVACLKTRIKMYVYVVVNEATNQYDFKFFSEPQDTKQLEREHSAKIANLF